jgi:hypothetical protein
MRTSRNRGRRPRAGGEPRRARGRRRGAIRPQERRNADAIIGLARDAEARERRIGRDAMEMGGRFG